MNLSASRSVILRFGTFLKVVTMYDRMGTTGLIVGSAVVGFKVGANDIVGLNVGISVGLMGAGV